MRTVKRRTILGSLQRKGFEIIDRRDHYYCYFFYGNKKTIVRTKVSKGAKYKEYGIGLLTQMRKQLRLDTIEQTLAFLECPLGKEDYTEILKRKQIIDDDLLRLCSPC